MTSWHKTGTHPFFLTSWHKTGAHPFYIGMYIHIYTHIYVHKYTSQKECLHIFFTCFLPFPVEITGMEQAMSLKDVFKGVKTFVSLVRCLPAPGWTLCLAMMLAAPGVKSSAKEKPRTDDVSIKMFQ